MYQEQIPKQQPEKKEAFAEPKQEQEYIFLKVGHRIQKITTRDILFIEGMKVYLRIYTAKEKIMTLLSFAKLEALLTTQDFARVHRSFMVALDKIAHIEKNRIRIGDQIIPISDTYSESF